MNMLKRYFSCDIEGGCSLGEWWLITAVEIALGVILGVAGAVLMDGDPRGFQALSIVFIIVHVPFRLCIIYRRMHSVFSDPQTNWGIWLLFWLAGIFAMLATPYLPILVLLWLASSFVLIVYWIIMSVSTARRE